MRIKSQTLLAAAAVTACLVGSADAATVGYANTVLADNPLLYYQLDETSGTVAANSGSLGSGLDATAAVGTVTNNQASFNPVLGTAYDFGGGVLASAGTIGSTLTEWTFEAWVNYDSAKTFRSTIFANDQGGWNNDVLIGIVPEGTSETGLSLGDFGVSQQSPPSGPRDVAGSALAADTWVHVAVVGSTSAGTLTTYINGVQTDQDSSLTGGVSFNDHNVFIGSSRGVNEPGYRAYDGLLDEVALYGSALEASDFQARINAVPEPGSLALLGLGGLLIARRRRG